ncbi:MAG: hypothetical protein DGJ47_001090 [Rickettsiaceae bacterium]
MFLIVGLGNPGLEYENTRHNIGFRCIEQLAEKYGAVWHHKSKYNALITPTTIIEGVNVVMCKPQTYMNLSGNAVQSVAAFYKIKPENIIVLHDEIDLPVAKIMYKFSGGNAGHNGLKSITQNLGNNFHRIRIGVGRPQHPEHQVSDYVLEKIPPTELQSLQTKIKLITDNIDLLLHNKMDQIKKIYQS